MILPLMQKFPWGEPTFFEEKLNGNWWPSQQEFEKFCRDASIRLKSARGLSPYKKITTIREDIHDRWKPGRTVHGYYGSRTKAMRKVWEGKCVSVQYIKIKTIYLPEDLEVTEILISDTPNGTAHAEIQVVSHIMKIETNKPELEKFFMNDGLEPTQFLSYFNGETFRGKIIHFTNLRY